MRKVFNVTMRVVSTLLGVCLMLSGTVWILQGLNVAFAGSFMFGDYRWAIYGAIAVVVGTGQAIWSNTRQA